MKIVIFLKNGNFQRMIDIEVVFRNKEDFLEDFYLLKGLRKS